MLLIKTEKKQDFMDRHYSTVALRALYGMPIKLGA
jgi:hypothetical protein